MKKILCLILTASLLFLQVESCLAFYLPNTINLNPPPRSDYLNSSHLGGVKPSYTSQSYLAGIGIRSMINPGIDPRTGEPRTMWQGIMNGLTMGVANIGLQWAGQELGVSPLISSLTFSAIASGIKALFGGQDIFATIFSDYMNGALSALGAGLSNNPWTQSAYLAQIIDFANIVKEKGLANALETYAAGIFNQVAINSMVQIAGSVGNYFGQKITNRDYIEKNEGGFITRTYGIEDFGSMETAFDEFGNELLLIPISV